MKRDVSGAYRLPFGPLPARFTALKASTAASRGQAAAGDDGAGQPLPVHPHLHAHEGQKPTETNRNDSKYDLIYSIRPQNSLWPGGGGRFHDLAHQPHHRL